MRVWTVPRSLHWRFKVDWQNKAKWLLGSRTIHIEGDGPFAFVTSCKDRAFSLSATRADAEEVRKRLMSCGSDCLGSASHYIVDLRLVPLAPASQAPRHLAHTSDTTSTSRP